MIFRDKHACCHSQAEDPTLLMLMRWAVCNQQGVGLLCGQTVGVSASSQCAIWTDTPTLALYKLSWMNCVLHRKDHQASALKAFP